MADLDPELDPLLAEAYRAERAQVEAMTAGLGAARERILLAAAARAAAVRPFWSAGRVASALLATALVSAALGFLVGRREPAAIVLSVDAGLADAGLADAAPLDAARLDAAPMDAGVADAAPIPARRRPPAGELNEPLLIDQARAALRRKLVDEAIAALAQHEARYPDGQLVEEREVLRIEADLMKGDRAAAAARIQRYRQRFPDGFLRDHVDTLLPGGPPAGHDR